MHLDRVVPTRMWHVGVSRQVMGAKAKPAPEFVSLAYRALHDHLQAGDAEKQQIAITLGLRPDMVEHIYGAAP